MATIFEACLVEVGVVCIVLRSIASYYEAALLDTCSALQ